MWKSRGYPITKSSNRTPVIGHPRDRAPITWEIGARRTNHDKKFCYRWDYALNRIFNKIIDHDWFSGAYLPRNWCTITWVSNYRCSIWTFCNRIPTWFLHQLRALKWLPSQCFLQFSKLKKTLQTFSLKRSSQKTFFIPKFVIDMIN